MALLNNPYIIDIIIGLFLIIYTFIGYLKGFIIRLYDFFSLFIAYFLTINFSFPLSKLITLYQLEGLLEPIGIKVNQLLVAVILFIVGYFILKGIGVLLKPFLKKIVSLLKMTKLLDHLLGLILSIIEGIIIVYFVLSMIFIPFINQGKETIEQTYIGSFIIDTMPHYFSSIADFKDLNQDIIALLDRAYNLVKAMEEAIGINILSASDKDSIDKIKESINSLHSKNTTL